MRAILTFRFPHWLRFRLPEEDREFADAVNGYKWRAALQDYDDCLRNILKYHGEEWDRHITIATVAIETVRNMLHDKIAERGLDLWD
jgi:hypothetical protein